MLTDGYVEDIVDGKIPVFTWLGTIIGILIMILGFGFIVATGGAGITIVFFGILVICFAMSKRDIEYEYLFVNDSVEVSKIIRKSKRKEVYHFANGDVNLIAKTDSIYVDNEHQKNPNIKLYNFASGKDVNPDEVYAFIISRDNKYEEVHLRLNDRTLKHVNTFFKDKLKA